VPRYLTPEVNTGIVPITRGGTSATNTGAALTNLGAIPRDWIGAPNGVAGLDVDGKLTTVIDSSQIDWGASGSPGELVALDVDGLIPGNLLPVADSNNRGAVKGGGNVIIAPDGTMSVDAGALGSGTVGIENDNLTDVSYYPMMSAVTSGTTSQTKISDAKLSFNPFSGTLNATGFNSLSDARHKTNVAKIENALEKVAQLSGYTFTYTDSNEASAGVIAQEVNEIMPMLVGEVNDRLNVNYNGLVGLLIAAINELSSQVAELKSQAQGA